MYEAAWSCTGCRRCMVNCPFGIDTGQIMGVAKHLLIDNGTAPEELVMLADAAVEKGKSIDEFKEGYRQVIRDLEKEVQQKLGLSSPEGLIPMEKKGAKSCTSASPGLIPSSIRRSSSTRRRRTGRLSFFEAVNFGFFAGDPEKATVNRPAYYQRGNVARRERGGHRRMRHRLQDPESTHGQTALQGVKHCRGDAPIHERGQDPPQGRSGCGSGHLP